MFYTDKLNELSVELLEGVIHLGTILCNLAMGLLVVSKANDQSIDSLIEEHMPESIKTNNIAYKPIKRALSVISEVYIRKERGATKEDCNELLEEFTNIVVDQIIKMDIERKLNTIS